MKIDFEEDEQIELPIVPMLDCAFLLLIFFLVATTFKQMTREVPLDLPSAESAINQQPGQELVISIDRDGNKYIAGEAVSTALFHQKIKETADAQPGKPVRIDADKACRYDQFIEVLDACQFEGLKVSGLRMAAPKN